MTVVIRIFCLKSEYGCLHGGSEKLLTCEISHPVCAHNPTWLVGGMSGAEYFVWPIDMIESWAGELVNIIRRWNPCCIPWTFIRSSVPINSWIWGQWWGHNYGQWCHMISDEVTWSGMRSHGQWWGCMVSDVIAHWWCHMVSDEVTWSIMMSRSQWWSHMGQWWGHQWRPVYVGVRGVYQKERCGVIRQIPYHLTKSLLQVAKSATREQKMFGQQLVMW